MDRAQMAYKLGQLMTEVLEAEKSSPNNLPLCIDITNRISPIYNEIRSNLPKHLVSIIDSAWALGSVDPDFNTLYLFEIKLISLCMAILNYLHEQENA